MPRPAPLAALVLLALVLAPGGGGARAEDPVAEPTPGAREALADLDSPCERTRRRAVERLVAGLPGTRAAVLEALPGADAGAQVLLVEVLAADGSPAAVHMLLETMDRGDEALAVRIRRALVRSPGGTRAVLEAWEREPALGLGPNGEPSARALALERLLRRAEAERLFVSRKSRSGSTGSYRGQYDVLLPYREEAVRICVGILTDRALPVPGIYTAGRFELLRPVSVPIDPSELESMAAHAFSELGRKTDIGALDVLRRHLADLDGRIAMEQRFGDTVRFRELLGQYADLLVALYVVWPTIFQRQLNDFLDEVDGRGGWAGVLGSSFVAIVLLRVGRYEEAVRRLEDNTLGSLDTGLASTHYNLACAYAQWGAQTEDPTARRYRLEQALDHLQEAVDNQWLDIGWMEEDRDLEPIRDTDRYRKMAAQVRAELGIDKR